MRFLCLSFFALCGPLLAVEPLDFAKDILPILERNCLPCHNATKSEGELNIETPKLMMKGGEHGPVIVPHKAAESLFYQSAAKTKKPFMPPADNKSKAQPLTSLQLELLRRWIDEGAVGEGKKREAPKWQSMPAGVGRVSALAVSAEGEFVAAARGGAVSVYALQSKQVAMELPREAHRDVVTSLAFSPDGLTLATGSFGEVKLWVRAAPAMSPEREARMKRSKAEHRQMATAFELTYQQGEKTKTEAQLKTFEEELKKATTELTDLTKRKEQIAKAVVEAEKKVATLKPEREKADVAAGAATAAKMQAEAERKTGKDAAALTKALEAAAKAEGEAQKVQKKVTDEFNTAVKALSEAKSEVGKSVDAERTSKKSAEDLAETKAMLASVIKALADTQKAAESATKALAALGEAKAVPADAPATWELKQTIGDATKVSSALTDRVNAIAFSPDGKLFATGSGDPSRSGEIKLWDARTFKLVRELAKPHKDVVLCLDFSADGTLLASGAADRVVRVWEVKSGKMMRSLEAHSHHVLGVSWRYDARVLASVSADASVKTWSLATGDVIKTVSDFKKEITGVRFIGYKNEIMGAAGDPMMWVLNDEGGNVRRDEKSFSAFLTCSTATADGAVQVVGDAKGKVWVFDAAGKLRAEW
jgi:hypothetical protein